MSNRRNEKQIGGRVKHQEKLFEVFQDLVRAKTRVDCSVLVTSESVSIRAKDYTDFVLAKGTISGMTGLPILRDLSCNSQPKLS